MIPDEREWQVQERAVKCARDGTDMTDGDAESMDYLAVARALRQPLDADLPHDFASRVAGLANARLRAEAPDSRFEQGLLVVLGLAMGVSALVFAVIYGGSWLDALVNPLGQVIRSNLAWPLALASCLALSWFTEQLRLRTGRVGHTLA